MMNPSLRLCSWFLISIYVEPIVDTYHANEILILEARVNEHTQSNQQIVRLFQLLLVSFILPIVMEHKTFMYVYTSCSTYFDLLYPLAYKEFKIAIYSYYNSKHFREHLLLFHETYSTWTRVHVLK